MNRIWGICIALLSMTANASFEQAYAPINVGSITIFIPIELLPEKASYLSLNTDSGQTRLAWSPVSDADYYQIQHFENGQWVSISDQYTSTHYSTQSITGPFRVRACHRYGCADWQSNIRNVQDPLNIQAFYSDSARSDDAGRINIGWSVLGASSVTLTQKVAGSVVSVKQGLNPTQGVTTPYISGLTEFTLSAHGFGGQVIHKNLSVTSKPKFPIQLQGQKGGFKQPLYESSLDIVEKSIVEYDDNLFFATHDGLLMFYQGVRRSDGEVTWRHGWNMQLEGIINNAPVVDGDFLYFTESYFDNTGQACRVRWLDASAKVCSDKTNNNLLASPVMVKPAPEVNLGFVASVQRFAKSFTSSAQQQDDVQTGLYVFHRDGTIDVLDPHNNLKLKRQFSLKNSINQTQGIVTTPSLIMNQDIALYKPQFVIQQADELMGVDVPAVVKEPELSTMETISQWFRMSPSAEVSAAGSAPSNAPQGPEELKVVWRDGI
ncbi:hypothetical protein N474_19335 [Pseudoalteromonas luteoviolacea CPMOR-2]|uniref:Fibronectin type-III domain-containing protein n=1 Tax=Pseudoalteromonas luteoviolacea DSM 6061 TaxID=1365250 RepID=A0A166VRY4_9GAMM|nr:hypothetical protein [Pseudoalteromonas luteoviolacea]KZN33634.1 hypothetical protein N475_19875 [Pseudoalteromonas luteoviolacea DSM 6061]KZN53726.1 hypothetical protein N474_19335 [Pseudoalteromonas luteoviolacea CPMOR-2]MBE0389544.1 hypothetical protein [Pseudoalteromonas luteoviolacea DSM 6061]